MTGTRAISGSEAIRWRKSRHLHLSIQQSVVHIYIDDLRTVFHLLAGKC